MATTKRPLLQIVGTGRTGRSKRMQFGLLLAPTAAAAALCHSPCCFDRSPHESPESSASPAKCVCTVGRTVGRTLDVRSAGIPAGPGERVESRKSLAHLGKTTPTPPSEGESGGQQRRGSSSLPVERETVPDLGDLQGVLLPFNKTLGQTGTCSQNTRRMKQGKDVVRGGDWGFWKSARKRVKVKLLA